ncbi:peptide chain release factor N(5)-glutamine methyltransferase [Candidatus Peregrinibacteria bacterium]|nr:MAG: peptide chain release factor N(5)-glutamine methyltransferase [Candidatus Peregrinibacteria bacterium]
MNIYAFLEYASRLFTEISECPKLEAELILAHVLAKPCSFLIAHPEYQLSTKQQQEAGILIQKRRTGTPLAYLTGMQEFYGLPFLVTPDVLIPRPETELLVERAISFLQKGGGTLLDIGTGSGCIAISVAHNAKPHKIIGVDISPKALLIARKNARLHKRSIQFLQGDLLPTGILFSKLPRPLIIAANLPYVPEGEAHSSTRQEPQSALYSGKDGLLHYKRLFPLLKNIEFDVLLFEFHPPQQKALEEIATRFFPTSQGKMYPDLSGLPRIGEIIKTNFSL